MSEYTGRVRGDEMDARINQMTVDPIRSLCARCGEVVYDGLVAEDAARAFKQHAKQAHGITVQKRAGRDRATAFITETDLTENQMRARLAGSPFKYDDLEDAA